MSFGPDLRLFSHFLAELRRWPGLSTRNIYRLALSFVQRPVDDVSKFCESLLAMRNCTKLCKVCFSLTEFDLCIICADENRDKTKICVVSTWAELFVIKSALSDFKGLFHVLGGLLSPLEGVSVADLYLDQLVSRLNDPITKEVVFAFSPVPEGEVTMSLILSRLCERVDLKVFKIARGIPVGASLEFTDRSTLTQAFVEKQLL